MDFKEVNRNVIEQFRADGEIIQELLGIRLSRDGLVLLTTFGRKSGQRYTTPVTLFHRDGDRLIVVAGNRGAPMHPDWYLNVVANPHVTVEVSDEIYDAVAITTKGEEREHLWRMLLERVPALSDLQTKSNRTFPVVALTRV